MSKRDGEIRPAFAEGALSLVTVLKSGSRTVKTVYYANQESFDRHAPKPAAVAVAMARGMGVPVVSCSMDFIKDRATGQSHGGLIAEVGERKMQSAEELCETENPFLAFVCGIEDPYNFGSALRSLYAAGCDGVFVPARNWLSAAGVVIRASAGASELIKLAPVPEASDFLALLGAHRIRPVCAREKNALPLMEADLSRPLCLVIGGEKRGMDKALDKTVHDGVQITYGRRFSHSLSADAAAAILAFEVLRQSETKGNT